MKKLIFIIFILFIANLYSVANTYFIRTDYIKYIKKGGAPSKYSKDYIAVEIDTINNEIRLYKSVQIEPESFQIKDRMYYYEINTNNKVGRVNLKANTLYLFHGVKETVKSTSMIFIKSRSSFNEIQELIDSVNNTYMSGSFNIDILHNDSLFKFKGIVFNNNGKITLKNIPIGYKSVYTYIDCGRYYDALILDIRGMKFDSFLKKTGGSGYTLFQLPSKPCEKKNKEIGRLFSTSAVGSVQQEKENDKIKKKDE